MFAYFRTRSILCNTHIRLQASNSSAPESTSLPTLTPAVSPSHTRPVPSAPSPRALQPMASLPPAAAITPEAPTVLPPPPMNTSSTSSEQNSNMSNQTSIEGQSPSTGLNADPGREAGAPVSVVPSPTGADIGSSGSGGSDGSDLGVWAGVGVALALLVCSAIGAFAWLRRRREFMKAAPPPGGTAAESVNGSSSRNTQVRNPDMQYYRTYARD